MRVYNLPYVCDRRIVFPRRCLSSSIPHALSDSNVEHFLARSGHDDPSMSIQIGFQMQHFLARLVTVSNFPPSLWLGLGHLSRSTRWKEIKRILQQVASRFRVRQFDIALKAGRLTDKHRQLDQNLWTLCYLHRNS